MSSEHGRAGIYRLQVDENHSRALAYYVIVDRRNRKRVLFGRQQKARNFSFEQGDFGGHHESGRHRGAGGRRPGRTCGAAGFSRYR